MTTELLDPREILLDGSVNFRDLGGLETKNGESVRRGMVFRSDALHGLTPIDLEKLAELRIATLIDLRSDDEVIKSGPSPLVETGTLVLRHSIIGTVTAPRDVDLSKPMEVMYAGFLTSGSSVIGTIFTSLAREEHLPTVIHCAAGKDRTGITIALLLRVLGVADELIAHDYSITDRNMERLRARLIPAMVDGKPINYPPHVMRAMPETMLAFLQALDETYGSAEDYLITTGISTTQLDTIRKRLLTTPA
jgi:protein tyrosine/serine phosphatase